jgi:hypothetical protein
MVRKTTPCSTKTSPLGRARRAVVLAALAGASSFFAVVPGARADEVSPTGKGIAGGILLGGEVVTITESLIGVRAGWAYALGGGLGMVAGGIAGHFVETADSTGQGSTYMLAGGMALIIPALVLSLNATRYHPSENATEDKPPPGIPPADPGAPGGNAATGSGTVVVPVPAPAAAPAPAPSPAPAPATPAPPPPPTSLLDLTLPHQAALRLGVPVPDVRPMYSRAEQKAYGLPQQTEVRMPVFKMTF